MSIRFHRYGLLLGFLVIGATTGCDSQRNTLASPTPVPALSSGVTTTFRFEPATLRSEEVFQPSCVGVPAFGTRIIIIVDGGDVVLRGLRFAFTDRLGVKSLPRIVAIPGPSPLSAPAPGIPTSFPIPIPGIAPLPVTSPIPIPGPASSNGVSGPAGTPEHLPFFLFFGCGVAAEGMLVVTTEVVETGGRIQTSEFRVRVAR